MTGWSVRCSAMVSRSRVAPAARRSRPILRPLTRSGQSGSICSRHRRHHPREAQPPGPRLRRPGLGERVRRPLRAARPMRVRSGSGADDRPSACRTAGLPSASQQLTVSSSARASLAPAFPPRLPARRQVPARQPPSDSSSTAPRRKARPSVNPSSAEGAAHDGSRGPNGTCGNAPWRALR